MHKRTESHQGFQVSPGVEIGPGGRKPVQFEPLEADTRGRQVSARRSLRPRRSSTRGRTIGPTDEVREAMGQGAGKGDMSTATGGHPRRRSGTVVGALAVTALVVGATPPLAPTPSVGATPAPRALGFSLAWQQNL